MFFFLYNLRNGLLRWRRWSGRETEPVDEEPLRAELFSIEQLERHAKSLAGAHVLARRRGKAPLLARLSENEDVLLDAYELIADAAGKNHRISPAAEWLLDNFYLIEEQCRTARRHLPKRYSSELPLLESGPHAGLPRVYSIAFELISHVDGRVDATSLTAFVAAYQTGAPLKLGELWAVPIMLRLALIENLRRVASRIASDRHDRSLADEWADRLIEVADKNLTSLILVLADMARAELQLSSAFVVELTSRLQGQNASLSLATGWIEQRLNEQGQSIEQMVRSENHGQAADQVTMGHTVTSLRFLGAMDWREFVESMSVVERVLRHDPSGAYPDMDFATRDRYRHIVEFSAAHARKSEIDAAEAVVALARRKADAGDRGRAAHVGYYLIDAGRPEMERAVGVRLPLAKRLERLVKRQALPFYVGSIAFGVACLVAIAAFRTFVDVLNPVQFWFMVAAAAIGASQLSLVMINWLATLTFAPERLPRMDYGFGIPPDQRTLVAIPTMLASAAMIDDLVEKLEIRYLGNRDPNLHFALLTDFKDASIETTPEDEVLLRRAVDGINALNEKYAEERADIFHLFHRPRRWNGREGRWMGWERKRGKLSELNALLRGAAPDRFSVIVGQTAILEQVRHVITLDTDTQLPRDSAHKLIGTIAHPLNAPLFDERKGVVTQGYGILQPRVSIALPSARRSWYARVCSGDPGVDPYTKTVSDVYQDLFREGSFIGKGIYNVDAFEAALRDRLPENRILSHDLLEGCYARSGLVSDIELFEDYPSSYLADMSRRHRWIRGDWQIARWLLRTVPGSGNRMIDNPLSALSRWKIFDNLRRSLVAPAMLALFLGGWFIFPHHLWFLAFMLAVFYVMPAVVAFIGGIADKSNELPWLIHFRQTLSSSAVIAAQSAFQIAVLPYEAAVHVHAVGQTLWRMLATRRGLLQWKTATEAESEARHGLGATALTMWQAPAIAAASFGGLYAAGMLHYVQYAPLAAWLLSPVVAWRFSKPWQRQPPRLSQREITFLRKAARRTWRFFEDFVTADENWLPPDNFQEHPNRVVAHRTSPTNIGLSLLSNLAARDFGYCSGAVLLDRTADAIATLDRLERYRGHFYNWYDTKSLKPLPPMYVSTVDSGNLSAHVLTLRQGLIEEIRQPLLHLSAFEGIRDTLHVALDHAKGLHRGSDDQELLPPDAIARLEAMDRDLAVEPGTLTGSRDVLKGLLAAWAEITATIPKSIDEHLAWWLRAIERAARDHLEDLQRIAGWLVLDAPPAALLRWDCKECNHLHEVPDLLRHLDGVLTLEWVAALPRTHAPRIDAMIAETDRLGVADADGRAWLTRLRQELMQGATRADERIRRQQQLAQRCLEIADADYTFLFDPSRELFSIGYNTAEHRLDPSYYDLLASEARLTSFLAIAQGQVDQDHWFALGRLLTNTASSPALLSWSGSMFEYLMPLLVMPTYEDTLLDRTNRAVVRRHVEYGNQRGLPWGVSESGYNLTDLNMNYQYRAFGVPGLGLKRGLAEDLVVAPYASALALMVEPDVACRNLQRFADEGEAGAYGFYEAIDYTPSRLPREQSKVVIRSFMVHHLGMSLLAYDYVLLNRPMQRRFYADPLFKSVDLLLQERVPKGIAPVYPHAPEVSAARRPGAEAVEPFRLYTNPNAAPPEVHLLSNGRYHVMVNSAGGGYSRWRDLAVTRWREDPTRDAHGLFCYLRDAVTGEYWSTSHQPTLKPGRNYEAIFTQARAEFRRRDFDIDAHTEIAVSPEDDLELRRVTLTNRSRDVRVIEITTYGEAVLAPHGADAAHPMFSNLFVQTHLIANHQAILCTRRPRSQDERPPWLFHQIALHGDEVGEASYETDRSLFIGRQRNVADPAAMQRGGALSNSAGSVLDPVCAIRRTVRIAPEESVIVDVTCGMAETREAATILVEKYRERRLSDRVFELAWTHNQIVLRHLNVTEPNVVLFARLASSIIYTTQHRRAAPSVLARNRRGQSGLWGHGISGDYPLALVRISDVAKIDLVRLAVQAHALWRTKGLAVDLVIWIEDYGSYRQQLHDQIMGLIGAGTEAQLIDKPGGIFVRRPDQISEEDRVLIQTLARVVLNDADGTLSEQVERRFRPDSAMPRLSPTRARRAEPAIEMRRDDLAFFNGHGGFTQDGKEYVIVLNGRQVTPLPWCNVIANRHFGTLVSESGAAYTWLENAHEFRLTPWSNDPISDASGEAVYLRDEETGQSWSPTPLPARGASGYIVRHGFGYSVFEHNEGGIVTELWTYVAIDAPVKFTVLKVRNASGRWRKLSATAYWELVLGELRAKNHMHITTEYDPKSGALCARNPYNADFPERIVFADVSEPIRSMTGDRAEFIGRNGTLASPSAMNRVRLSNKVGSGLDPCAAFQAPFELGDGDSREIVFLLGVGRDEADVQQLVNRFQGPQAARAALEEVWSHWNRTLGAVRVETPDPSFNALANGWLLYQTLSCRIWGRTGFYQSGGAFGFRDQLQDVMALTHAAPWLTREHILYAAGHQFREGDVQHWWHPPVNRGVRTHFSDDYLWLPFAVCHYVAATADTGCLDERIPFLDGRPVNPGEESYYDLPHKSDESGTLYEHCVRAITRGLRFGAHGLPLMGCGDWNDGMNRVGIEGKGESVWLAFFLYDTLTKFADVARARGDAAFAQRCLVEAANLQNNIEAHAWDGEWYRRAYFDDGQPLGSAENPECQIDSLPQSWSVLALAGDTKRSQSGMDAVYRRLVNRNYRLIQLFEPPFDSSHLNPGYIKGYVPGVRENGGQYTHAAIWTCMAFAQMGDVHRAWELFSLLNPITHGNDPAQIGIYKVEPYVIAADVYAVAPHGGRGGWTWYTGSAGWMYRLMLESLLGVELRGESLRIRPCVPGDWKEFAIRYRYRETVYVIRCSRKAGAGKVIVDGVEAEDGWIRLTDDRQEHRVEVELGV